MKEDRRDGRKGERGKEREGRKEGRKWKYVCQIDCADDITGVYMGLY
jgi:hypothetical protein